MTTTALRYTFAEHCSHAVRFVPCATGMLGALYLSPQFDYGPATSDPVRNQVDVYSGAFEEVVGVVVMPAQLPLLPTYLWSPVTELPAPAQPATVPADPSTEAPEVAVLARRIRELAGLPVSDLAAMIGVGRRQFYNLLDHGSTSLGTELRVHHLAAQLERLAGIVGEDPAAIRSALLTPVGRPARSLFEVALAWEDSKIEETFGALVDRIERRGLRQVPRAVPRRRAVAARDASVREVLGELPAIEVDQEEAED
ncbi:MAG TPA: hypothetical protein VLC07_01995 [Solirubrobacterales bacterium]|nr:hypothetical protein [Solirubrobacterales bacterium]